MAVQNFGTGGGGFQLSPGVNFSEIDLTNITPAVSTTVGAFAGVFRWGPVNQPNLVTSESDLVNKFGKPTNLNPETFFTAANFLSYSNSLYVTRVANTSGQFAAIASGNTGILASANYTVFNDDDYTTKKTTLESNSDVNYVARYVGEMGNSLKISVCESAEQFSSVIGLANATFNFVSGATTYSNTFQGPNTGISFVVGSDIATITLDGADVQVYAGNTAADSTSLLADATVVADKINIGDYFQVKVGSSTQSLKVTQKSSVNVHTSGAVNTGIVSFDVYFDQPYKLSTSVTSNTVTRFWEYASYVDGAPGRSDYVSVYGNTTSQIANTSIQNDEVHVVISDEDGVFSGSPGAILEVYKGLSRATDAKLVDGGTNYFRNVINQQSNYVWVGADRVGATTNTAINIISSTNPTPLTVSFRGAVDVSEADMAFSDIARGYDYYVSPEDIDVSLVITGKSRSSDGVVGEQLANYLIDNIAEVRQDCVVFLSPTYEDVVNQPNRADENVVEFRNSVRPSSYAVMDSGYKYQYDKYNDVYRWIPLNGDIAGLCVRTDSTRDPWFSPAGTTRGQIRNIIKLAYNPNKAQRDLLYKNSINPVITQPGSGTILYGDKTLLSKPSAFDRINVRRLFIALEKTISRASKSFLFEFNDEFTRAQFRNLVEPFLRDIQGRRGIYDFRVVCDETNNTAEVIDSNRFIGDIYIKPARSINFIQLNFIAVRSGVEFSEIVG